MSFKLFLYYCSLCGGWAAFLGWSLGRLASPSDELGRTLVQGLFLGFFVSLALEMVDTFTNHVGNAWKSLGVQLLVAFLVGCGAGLLGAGSQWLFHRLPGVGVMGSVFRGMATILGWTLTGLVIGASVGAHEWFGAMGGRRGTWSRQKLTNGLLGGGVGGLIGGILYLCLSIGLSTVFGKDNLLSPSAFGFVALGLSLGFLIGLVQVLLKEAWIVVESGFRPGREMILSKPEITVGKSESSDIGLFGDSAVERTHARITRQGSQYLLTDSGAAAGTLVNGERVQQARTLQSGDRIQIGSSVLLFGERQKRR